MTWYIKVLRQYTEFEGRARRKEYWMFTLINLIIIFSLGIVGGVYGEGGNVALIPVLLYFGYALAVLIPGLAVSVRRLHDTGRSGWWFLISLVPFIGTVIFLILMALDSEEGENKYGPNPKTTLI